LFIHLVSHGLLKLELELRHLSAEVADLVLQSSLVLEAGVDVLQLSPEGFHKSLIDLGCLGLGMWQGSKALDFFLSVSELVLAEPEFSFLREGS
jgi:hypothetical protein